MRIVFVASEGVPFSKTGGLADVVGALPKALVEQGLEVDVILPRYRITNPGPTAPSGASITIPLASGFKFASIEDGGTADGVRHYLVDCPEYFDRDGLYQEKGKADFPDNYMRFAAFSLAALEFLKRFPAPPDVIHCHDWQTALVPVYLRHRYAHDGFFQKTPVVFTLHNLAYQGLFPPHILPEISLDVSLLTVDALEYYAQVNLLKGGIVFSDAITTVSRRYAAEIQTKEFGCGLEGVLQKRSDHIRGILNGVDYDAWNPSTDKLIAAHYTVDNLKGKSLCKKALLEKMGAKNPALDRPVLGIVSRFDRQKGFDLIAAIAENLATQDLYIVALGTGAPEYESLFRALAAKYPDKFLVKVAYDNTVAHEIEAGADMFLMPSRYEPSGLNQMYSLKYGTVPIVRVTGGLDDSIEDFDGTRGTGFKFSDYSSGALLSAITRALETYRDLVAWRRVMQNGMKKDFSWGRSAKEYVGLYEKLAPARGGIKTPAGASKASGG
ncbi:MAG TPA: glycogen synthase GlgA [Terriglobia bacterium]|nr:glycogen synthase GlgA [Terriglobia bacterium]